MENALKIALQYLEDFHINGTVTVLTKIGFEYMTCNGDCYFVAYKDL